MFQQAMYLESLVLDAYQALNLAVYVKNLNGLYLWANHFFIRQSAGFKSLSEILTSTKQLFNPRRLCHASGAFPLTTFMHCGGSIVIPAKNAYSKTEQARTFDWAELMYKTPQVTHASFELVCNAVANSPLSSPDPRGIGSTINSLHPEIIDEQDTILP